MLRSADRFVAIGLQPVVPVEAVHAAYHGCLTNHSIVRHDLVQLRTGIGAYLDRSANALCKQMTWTVWHCTVRCAEDQNGGGEVYHGVSGGLGIAASIAAFSFAISAAIEAHRVKAQAR